MEKHTLISDLEFEKQFETCTLQPECFTHEAHLRLAWIHIRKYGLPQAIENVNEQIVQYAESLGAKDKFNKTITVAAVKAIYHFMNRSRSIDFNTLLLKYPRLKTDFKGLMFEHYTFDIFNSTKARKEFLEPDLLPFD